MGALLFLLLWISATLLNETESSSSSSHDLESTIIAPWQRRLSRKSAEYLYRRRLQTTEQSQTTHETSNATEDAPNTTAEPQETVPIGPTLGPNSRFGACRCTDAVKITLGEESLVRYRGISKLDTRRDNITKLIIPKGCRVTLKRYVGMSDEMDDMSLTAGTYFKSDLDYHEVSPEQPEIKISNLCTTMLGAMVAIFGIYDRQMFFTMEENHVVGLIHDVDDISTSTLFRIVEAGNNVALWNPQYQKFFCIHNNIAVSRCKNSMGILQNGYG